MTRSDWSHHEASSSLLWCQRGTSFAFFGWITPPSFLHVSPPRPHFSHWSSLLSFAMVLPFSELTYALPSRWLEEDRRPFKSQPPKWLGAQESSSLAVLSPWQSNYCCCRPSGRHPDMLLCSLNIMARMPLVLPRSSPGTGPAVAVDLISTSSRSTTIAQLIGNLVNTVE